MADVETPVIPKRSRVFLELRKRLQTGLLIVRRDVADSRPDVVVSGGDATLHIRTCNGELSVALPSGVAFEQGSSMMTSAGAFAAEELHVRLRINTTAPADEETSDRVIETLRAKQTYCFYCRGCMSRLLEDRLFKRVLPLPNGNWNAIVDDWCCHPDPFPSKKLLPRADDCLLGDTFLLLARDGSCEHTLAEELSAAAAQNSQDPKKSCRRLAVVSCKSCSFQLGEAVAPGTLKLYVTQVAVEPSVGDRRPEAAVNRSLFVERVIAAKMLELSNSQSTFRFSVQSPDGNVLLLLWMLNSDSVTASVCEADVDDQRWSGSSDLHSPSPRASAALKVLYICCSDVDAQQRDIVTSWEVSAAGHPVVLPLTVCEELLRVVRDSNATLPASMRHMTSYQVAYLRL